MEIVIKIPEDTYKKCKWENNGVVGLEWWERAIANGTPLPKGHGRLVDADAYAKKFVDTNINGRIGEEYIVAPTIIEADTAEKERKNDYK